LRDVLHALEADFRAALAAAGLDLRAIDAVRVRFLGKKGALTALMKGLAGLSPDERPAAGLAVNAARDRLEQAVEAALGAGQEAARRASLAGEGVDVTLPSHRPFAGSLHPVTLTRREMERIFREMGFTVETGPEVEDDFHNFQALNLPPDHPARDATDTFYLPGDLLLRTHTSPVQIRTMETQAPPIRMVCPGRVYRRDMDATHLPMFHQLECLVVDEDVALADLKGTLAAVWSRFFGDEVSVRLRPGYFPFVEPGAEYDVSCVACHGAGCRLCKGSGWIELGGAGMVHPAVFEAVGIDAEKWTGFAFGLGIDRIAMSRYAVDDLRLLMESDVRFLARFPG
jgi:phenylalanyl-tRNA synthetase alpha chain